MRTDFMKRGWSIWFDWSFQNLEEMIIHACDSINVGASPVAGDEKDSCSDSSGKLFEVLFVTFFINSSLKQYLYSFVQ